MKGKSIWLALLLGGVLLSLAWVDARAEAPEEIGKLYRGTSDLAGSLRAAFEVVMDGEIVRTESDLAIVHLDNGQVLKLEPNSAARFVTQSFDEIDVTVFSGRVIKWSRKGRPSTAGAGSKFTLGRSLQDPLAAEEALLRVDEPLRSRRHEESPAQRGLSR
jgi:hypothetical protein